MLDPYLSRNNWIKVGFREGGSERFAPPPPPTISEIRPPADPKGPLLCYFRIIIFGDGPLNLSKGVFAVQKNWSKWGLYSDLGELRKSIWSTLGKKKVDKIFTLFENPPPYTRENLRSTPDQVNTVIALLLFLFAVYQKM